MGFGLPIVDEWSTGRSFAGYEGVSFECVSQGLIGGFADADTRSNLKTFGAKAVSCDPQGGTGRGEIASVIASAGDAESFGEPSGAAGESN